MCFFIFFCFIRKLNDSFFLGPPLALKGSGRYVSGLAIRSALRQLCWLGLA
ncbi:hypothetical protein SGRA_2209 [Saprospira grandis str. Lewin]|uniref:Uncharacterized protein n=1 Tax=Saprospira grandis (strain Lewin) TaxID=984262 RepID=H6L3J0_SAPGL|nr:hypothetical protein SGRA_2209 [Saprospira grandis str. Lewin]